MALPSDSLVPQGSLILVTGATGFLGGIVVDQLLQNGYRVRGTVRDAQGDRASWLVPFLEDRYGANRFEAAQVEDMAQEGCLDSVVKGCSGIIHVASVTAAEADPAKIITPSIAFLENALAAAKKEPCVQRFVLTSSSAAVSQDKVNEAFDLTPDMWAEWAVREAWAPPPYTMDRARANYYASKVLTEQRLWQYVEQQRPRFQVNSVLPDFIIGLNLNPRTQGYVSSMGLFKQMFDDSGDVWRSFGAQWCVDVVDTALLHVAALACPDVSNERIFAFAHRKTWTDIIQRLKQMYPARYFPMPDPNEGNDLSNVIGRDRAEGLLRRMGRQGWKPLEASLREVSEALVHDKF